MRSKLGKVRGLGSAHHGVSHWWLQRITALAIAPLSVWFMFSLVTVLLSPSVMVVAQWFSSPVNAVAMILLLLAMFTHARLGVQVVVEDYVSCRFKRYALLMLNTLVSVTLSVISVLAVLKLHFLDVVTTM